MVEINKFKHLISNRPFFPTLVVNIFFIAFIVLFMPFRYETMDDRYYLAWVTSGYLSGVPDCHTFFMNAIYCWVESKLYTILPSVEWHTWLLLTIHLVSLSSIGICIISTNHTRISKILILFMLYLIELYLLTNLQFTTTAGLAATAGILLIIGNKRIYWLGCLLFIIASMVRYPAAMFCGVVTAAFFPLVIIRQGFCRQQLLALAICAMGAFALHLIDKQIYYQDNEWKDKYEFNLLRGRLFDNSNTWRIYINPPEGLHSRDFDLMGTIFDTVNWSEEVHQQCLEEIERQTAYHGIPGLKKIKNIPNELNQFRLWFIVLFIVIIGCLINCKKCRECVALFVGALSLPVAMAIVALNTRIVLHAFLCGWIPAMFILLTLVPFRKKASYLWLIITISLTIYCIMPKLHLKQLYTSKDLFDQQMELVKHGESLGVKYFVVDFNTEYCEYPWGIRYHFMENSNKVLPISSTSLEMTNNKEYAFLLNKESHVIIMNGLEGMLENSKDDSIHFSPTYLCCNNSYVLFALKRD